MALSSEKKGGKAQTKRKGAAARGAAAADSSSVTAKLAEKDMAVAELEAIVFGKGPLVEKAPFAPKPENKRKNDTAAAAVAADAESGSDSGRVSAGGGGRHKSGHAAAWTDPDDAELEVDLTARGKTRKLRRTEQETKVSGTEYERRLREQFVKLNGNARWAKEVLAKPGASRGSKKGATDSDDESEGEEVATSSKAASRKVGEGALPPEIVTIARRRDLVLEEHSSKGPAVIQSVQFHPTSELCLTAGFDKRLRLFAVDGEENPKMSSHFFKKFPIEEASFTPNGDQVLMTGRDSWDMWALDVRTGTALGIKPLISQANWCFHGLTVGPDPSGDAGAGLRTSSMYSVLGDSGTVVISDVSSKHVVRTMRMAAPGIHSVFHPEKDTLFTADKECNIYEWDLGTGRCLQRSKDPWATRITKLAIRGSSSYSPTPLLAVGTATGNIDMFDISGPRLSKEPVKTISNLVTAVGCMKFHRGGELLAASSRHKKNVLKMVHVGTGTVFANWPTERTPLGRVSALDISRRAGFLAIGNEKGRVLIYQLAHFERGS